MSEKHTEQTFLTRKAGFFALTDFSRHCGQFHLTQTTSNIGVHQGAVIDIMGVEKGEVGNCHKCALMEIDHANCVGLV